MLLLGELGPGPDVFLAAEPFDLPEGAAADHALRLCERLLRDGPVLDLLVLSLEVHVGRELVALAELLDCRLVVGADELARARSHEHDLPT